MLTELYEKYKATNYQDLPAINPLIFILRKAELGNNLTTSEWNWLEQYQLSETKEIIKSQESYRASIREEVYRELVQLKRNPLLVRTHNYPKIITIDWAGAFIFYKIHAHERLADSELSLAVTNYNQFLNFTDSKKKHGIIENIPFEPIAVNILEKLEKQKPLSAADIEWISTHNAYSFLTPLQNQLFRLQQKYKAVVQNGFNAYTLKICHILQKLDENTLLNAVEMEYLKSDGLTETLEIVQKREFSSLKVKYHATQIQEDDINHHLFKVLKKLEAALCLPEPDINYLKKRKLFETVKFVHKKHADSLIHKIAQGHGLRPEDVAWCEEYNFEEIIFQWLKKDYEVEHYQDKPESPLYLILKKLKINKRLTDDEIAWLEIEKWLIKKLETEKWLEERWMPYSSSKIFIAHHTLEARFNESEFQRTKDHWKLASASAHWRKAEEPEEALKQTDNLDFKKIKPAKLKAALFTTRGGALRDAGHLNEAELCAFEAIKYFPDSHNPYTLIGALCLQTGRIEEGLKWFDEAIKRGATPRDQDAEIRRILLKKTGKERNELIDQLLKNDRSRFAWVEKFRRDKPAT